ncbi:MAG: protein kinase, partial [Proteobacteria bacterium]|nr:protein kinase [Pseudomonadota bacterium]
MGEVATDRRDGRPAAPLRKNSASHSLPVGGPRYEFLHRLTVGGMAELHLARMHGIEGFQKHVVVKQLLPHCCGDPEFVSLFLDEARLAGQLDHQNIGQVHDVGQIDGRYFFAMEYLHGKDLRSLLERAHSGGDRIPLEHALTIVSHVAAALHYAHEKCDDDGEPLRIVHRDVSPANIIVTYDGGVKLVDFGIARATTRPSTTRTGTIRGKIFYMSPEQCLSKPIDARSDLFSLGIVMYELVTTSWLFRSSKSQSDYTIMSRIVRGDIPPPSAVVDDVPPALEDIILRALAIKPDDRHASAQELILEIEAMASTACIPLSTTALSQYLVDLFGRTPEPWRTIETLARQTGSEVDSATEPDDPSTGPDDADEPGDDTGEPGDDADEPGDDADEPGDDADEPGDD